MSMNDWQSELTQSLDIMDMCLTTSGDCLGRWLSHWSSPSETAMSCSTLGFQQGGALGSHFPHRQPPGASPQRHAFPWVSSSVSLWGEGVRRRGEKALEVPGESVPTAGNRKHRSGSAEGGRIHDRDMAAENGGWGGGGR